MKVTIHTNDIEFTDDSGNNATVIPKKAIVAVSGVFLTFNTTTAPLPNPNNGLDNQVYPFPHMTKVVINLMGRELTQEFECQKVTNQPTWSLGTQAALNQAVADIQASL